MNMVCSMIENSSDFIHCITINIASDQIGLSRAMKRVLP